MGLEGDTGVATSTSCSCHCLGSQPHSQSGHCRCGINQGAAGSPETWQPWQIWIDVVPIMDFPCELPLCTTLRQAYLVFRHTDKTSRILSICLLQIYSTDHAKYRPAYPLSCSEPSFYYVAAIQPRQCPLARRCICKGFI